MNTTLPTLIGTAAWFSALVIPLVATTELRAHGNNHASEPDIIIENATASNSVDLVDSNFAGNASAESVGDGFLAADIVRDAPAPVINPAVGGQWSAVVDWPLVAIHAALLPNGKVLAWDATPDDADDDPHTTDNFTTRVTLWDPLSDTHIETNNDTDTDLFCAGSAHLWDGRILFAGGDGGKAGANGPLSNSNIYNPVTNTWHRTEDMNAPRWYASVAALSNGEMLTLGGAYEPSPFAEVFQFDQTWRGLTSEFPIELTGDYQWLQQTPEGTVLSFGPSNLIVDINTDNSGSYSAAATRDTIDDRDYGSYAMYTTGKILIAGGEQSVNSAVIVDTATKQTTDTSPLTFGRRQHNLTILADGSVLASGGNSDGAEFYSPTSPVLVPELWDPLSGRWTTLNTIPSDRQYHSVALLLPDGKVLSAGGGICGDCYALGYEERNAEIFSPPYLFNSDGTLADRPIVSSVPNSSNYSQSVSVAVSHDLPISKVHLIKLGSVTHSENQDQRLVPINYSQANGRLSLTMPASRNVAPPGHYLLFVVDESGVPSTGSMLKLGQPLVGVEQSVNSILELNARDTYVTQPTQEAVAIELNAQAGTVLQVALNSPDVQSIGTGALCSTSVQPNGQARCEFNTSVGSQLHITVSGANRTDYSMVYRNTVASIAETITPSVSESATETDNPSGSGFVAVQINELNESDGVVTSQGGDTFDSGLVRTGRGAIAPILLLLLIFYSSVRAFCAVRRPV